MTKLAKISFDSLSIPSSDTVVLFSSANLELFPAAKKLNDQNGKFIEKAAKIADFSGKKASILDIIAPQNIGLDRVIVIGTGGAEADDILAWRNAGGTIAGHLLSIKAETAIIIMDMATKSKADSATTDAVLNIAHGLTLRQYKFDQYKTDAAKENGAGKTKELKKVSIQSANPQAAKKQFGGYQALQSGVFAARDLVNEPGNILGPDEYAKRIKKLSSLGLDIEILTDKELKKNNMNALLGVGEGSRQGSYLAIMKWNGTATKAKSEPIAIVGKGVTFDTGGISIKGAGGMEDMKGDMGGSATVVGLMQTLARRKAKANVIGVVGLVENMPDGQAQRPGDVVTSMSGQTIEIINTDAEGRLVLADALWYTQAKFNPKYMINLATLTGAIMVALGKEHAGLFSNNDGLSEMLIESGKETGEKVWRMPLSSTYNKLINSKFADMKNSGGRWGGAITAAQFLKRHVNDTPWAHLDIAGVAMDSSKTPISQSWASGFGVDLLNHWIANNFE